MKGKLGILLMLLAAVLLVACDTSLPEPIVGCYSVSEFEEESYGYYYLQLKNDHTFKLYQAGGASSSKGFMFTGKWSMELTAYDFTKANGELNFYEVKGPSGYSGLVLTPDVNNRYRFYWTKDKDTPKATIALESTNRYICGDIATGFRIKEETFNTVLASVGYGEEKDEKEN